MKKRNFLRNSLALVAVSLVGALTPSFAQEVELTPTEKNTQSIAALESKVNALSNLKVSGYVQAQYLWTETAEKTGFQGAGKQSDVLRNQFMVRRGRIKFAYTYGIAQVVFQPDFTEKGVGVKDAYALVTAPSKWIAGQMGIFDRPFGYEIQRSSSVRETPERSRVFLALFPGERDLGVQGIFKGKSGVLADFTLNAGLFNGNGIGQETDSKKDFIGKLAYLKKTSNASIGAAVSLYDGGVLQGDSSYVYTDGTGFVKTDVEKFSYAKRQYIGASAQYVQDWKLGTTYLCAEYIMGSQPGTSKANNDPNGTSLGNGTEKLYLRDFNGYYIQLAQNIGATKHTIVLKYDVYDPNTAVSGDDLGTPMKGTSSADIAYTTIGLGYNYRMNANVKLTAYYDMVSHETSANLKGYEDQIAQNMFTARVQIKF